ncbi:hypothetical protein Tco_0786333 [Tanacetum coccineum]
MKQKLRLKREAAERAFEAQAEKDRTLMRLEELRFLATSTKDLDDDDAYWIKKCADGENATLSEFQEVLKAMKMTSLIPLAGHIYDLWDNNRYSTIDMMAILYALC